jgi:polysaccharide export outer membrane protein
VKITHVWQFFVLVLISSACVTNKKYVYLQKDDVNISGLPKDSVLREYDLPDYDYKIQPNDIISVKFVSLSPKEFDFLTGDQQSVANLTPINAMLLGELVDDDGNIPFPVVGKIKVAGLNLFEAQDLLQATADQYLQSPIVKVRLLNFRITMLGEVNREGTITLSNTRISLMEAIGLAGGLTDLADKKNLKLIRQRNGKTEVQYIDVLSEDFMNSPNYYVSQNDVLIVPALKQRPFRKYFAQNVALVVSTLSLIFLIVNLSK